MARKLRHLAPLAELITTEEAYINTLNQIVTGYMVIYFDENSDIPLPMGLKNTNGYLVFANIVEIYNFHKYYFLKALKDNQSSIIDLSKMLLQNEHKFHMYAKYCSNKPISEHLVNNHLDYFDHIQIKLKHDKTIKDLLIAPVQRVVRYKILLEEILKCLKKDGLNKEADNINEALIMIRNVCKEVNEFAALNNIRNFDGLVSEQGKLLFHDFLDCIFEGKKRNLYVFLFERLMIFTEKQNAKGKYSVPTYNYRLKIPINKLRLQELPNSKFFLQLVDRNVPSLSITCQAATTDLHKKWLQAIKQQLMLQLNLVHNLVYPAESSEQREVLL